jgi:hypothetical protein
VSAHLTERDRRLLALLAEVRVLTVWQIARLEFGSPVTARHRMQLLVGLQVLDGFRPRAERGSTPIHYLLSPLGAAVVVATDPDRSQQESDKILRRARDDRQVLALGTTGTLAHTLGVNDFYVGLRERAARAGSGAELVGWEGERSVRDSTGEGEVYGHGCRPDAYGHWREGGHDAAFFLEYDRGTEQLARLVAKVEEFRHFFEDETGRWWMRQRGPLPWVLFCFLSEQRERHARRALAAAASGHSDLRVATAVVPLGADPGARVWLPLDSDGPRLDLASLPSLTPAAVPTLPAPRGGGYQVRYVDPEIEAEDRAVVQARVAEADERRGWGSESW